MSTYHPSHRRVRSGRTASGIRAGASVVFAAATAIGLLTDPVPAQAAPCAEYKFNGDFSLNQTNGWYVVLFNPVGPAANVGALATNNVDKMTGNATGGIQGRNVDFTIQWDSGPRGHYTGTVGDDARVHNGVSINQINADSANWDSISPLECVPPPAAPPPPIPAEAKIPIPPRDAPRPGGTGPAQGAAKTATVNQPSNIFNKPDGNGTEYLNAARVPIFKPPGQVQLVAPDLCRDNWCHVVAPEVPPGDGWIYIGDGFGSFP